MGFFVRKVFIILPYIYLQPFLHVEKYGNQIKELERHVQVRNHYGIVINVGEWYIIMYNR